MKKIRMALVGILVLALAGCAGESETSKNTTGESIASNEAVNEVSISKSTVNENIASAGAIDESTISDNATKEGDGEWLPEAEAGSSSTAQENVSDVIAEGEDSDNTESPTLTLAMVGDILLHTPVEESAKRPEGGYNFDAIFANVKEEIQQVDLALVNQEVIIGGEELGISGYPAFNAPYEVGDALVEAGFDVVCQGTNHALDKGRRGLLSCLAFWEEHYPEMGVLGIHDSLESRDSIYVYEHEGMKIAILNYTYGTNGIPLPEDMPYAVDMLEEERVVADIRRAEEVADFTIVCPHWGTEYELGISSQQEKWTEIFMENGVDLVLGTHPHVIEPVEWIVEEETGNEMLVYYSLGNFVNWTSGTGAGVANRMVGGMARVMLEQTEDGQVFIAEYAVEPLVCHVESGMDGVTVYFLEEYTEELASRNEIVQQDGNFSLEYCEQLCEQVWGE